jgi:hypothetical protein
MTEFATLLDATGAVQEIADRLRTGSRQIKIRIGIGETDAAGSLALWGLFFGG